MTFIDISWPLTNNMTPYKERKLFSSQFFRLWNKDKSRQSKLELDCHAGTHVDAPAHYIKNGVSIDKIKLEHFMGKCRVLNLTKVEEKIIDTDLEKFNIKKGEILLLKTKNSSLSPTAKFNYNFIYLEKSAAAYLVKKKIKTVGVDYLGIERNQPKHETHTLILGNEIAIIEGLRLEEATEGDYILYCLPLAVKGLEAAPVRAVLEKK